jgi:predicted RNA binding protein YcfA (HicA-like mRNA interferase family)
MCHLPKPLKAQEVWKRLHKHDSRFDILANRGKGSHRIIEHPDIAGKRQCIPLPVHKGKDVKKGILESIIRRFNLPEDIFD